MLYWRNLVLIEMWFSSLHLVFQGVFQLVLEDVSVELVAVVPPLVTSSFMTTAVAAAVVMTMMISGQQLEGQGQILLLGCCL